MLVSVTQLALDLPVAARVGVMGRQMRDKGTSWVDVLTDLGGAGRRQHVDDDAGTIVVHVFDRDRHLTVSTNTTRLIIITVVSTLADSYLHSTSHSAGSAAETASVRKESKYSSLPPEYLFQPVAIETLGPLNASAVNFLSEMGRRLTSLSGDPRETSFLFQRLSILIQRFNSALIMDSFCHADEDPDL